MQFYSILFDEPDKTHTTYTSDSSLIVDANLDQIIKNVLSYKKDFTIEYFFYLLSNNIKTINYRQEVVKDLQRDSFYIQVDNFCQEMLKIKRDRRIIKKFDEEIYKKSWFFQMMINFNETVLKFLNILNEAKINSDGFILFKKYISNYTKNDNFISMQKDIHSLQKKLSAITYDINIDGLTFKVKRYENEENYTKEIYKLFKKFQINKQDKNIECNYEKNRGTNHINAKILEFVSKLYPETFNKLDNFYKIYSDIIDETIIIFSNEVQFYISYIQYIKDIKQKDLHFCLPKLQTKEKNIDIKDGFDLALAYNLNFQDKKTVTNDYLFKDGKRIMIVSGANQGGKSTYARAFTQIIYLAKLGLPIPAKKANIFLPDKIFTHFEKEEKIYSLKSKLQEDLTRVYQMLLSSTPKTIIILNEIFSSTSYVDALFLSQQIIKKIDKLDAFCIWVTFINELDQMSNKTISMVSQVNTKDISERTYKVIPKKADGKAYATSIANKYNLNYDQIINRIKS